MENRQPIQVTQIVDYIKDIWSLSVVEEDVLDSVLILFSRQKTDKIKQLEYLLNEDTEELLETLHQRDIENYACNEFDLVSAESENDLVDALKHLNYDFLEEVTDEEIIEYLENDGWTVTMDKYGLERTDIVSDMQFEELNELFSNLDFISREKLLKELRK